MVGEGGSCGSGIESELTGVVTVVGVRELEVVLLGGMWTERGTAARSSSAEG